ncbi:MAG: hypothetical protein J1E06_05825 [Acutalibacter sp.]|nr:hypothetical protein [Acutalibacter sp.]
MEIKEAINFMKGSVMYGQVVLKNPDAFFDPPNVEKGIDHTKQNLEAYNMAISALLAQEELEKNTPLTLEELKSMDGQPVWVTPGGFWALVISRPGERVQLICNDGGIVWADKEIELVGSVYRHPPKKGETK